MEGKYANIIIDISHEKLDRTFQYMIPEELAGQLEIGMLVEIPFGKGNRIIKGYVMEITDQAEYDPAKMKYLIRVIQDDSFVESSLMKLAFWMKENYGSTMITSLKTVLTIKKQMKPKEKKRVLLCLSEEESAAKLIFYEKKHQVARLRLLQELVKEKTIPWEFITEKLNVTAAVVKAMENDGVCRIETEQVFRNSVIPTEVKGQDKTLSENQQKIVDEVLADYREGKRDTYLIHGVTGSGKTEVYMEIIDGVVKMGKQAIVLIPEIALTYQTVMRFYKRFGDRVSTLHSKLSEGERYDQFERAKRGDIDVMIGPRSALFTPFANLGIIVMDEEHEGSYKSEQVPKYHAREVAIKRAELSDACVILGSATPSMEAYYKAQNGIYRLYTLKDRMAGGNMADVYTVDLREELKNGNRSVFSDKLRELMKERLQKKEQTMLFLNRRGYAGFISCRACGHVMKCPHCDVSMSVHRNGRLQCHYCGYEQPNVKVCPECGSKYIGGMKAGTEQIETLLKKEFPEARVLRMDMDTTREKDSYEKILASFANEEADILVGTQMIVKGHDFPNVTLVGVLAADMSLYANDYRAGERTFQLLTQAAGRAGRGRKRGEVVIQTYSPENYSIEAAAKQDYNAFYEEEIGFRSLMGYPPVSHMLAILTESVAEEQGRRLAKAMADKIFKESLAGDRSVQVIGPSEAGIGKINDIYRQMVYIKCDSYERLTKVKDELEAYLEKMELKGCRVLFDFDPMTPY